MISEKCTLMRICGLCVLCMLFCANLTAQTVEIWQYYDIDKKQPKENYFLEDSISGKLTGPYKAWYTNGLLQTEGYYKDNLPDSTWTYYFENGKIRMQGSLSSGKNTGLWSYYYESGNLSMQGKLNGTHREGLWVYFYEKGSKKTEGKFVNNLKECIWNYFYEDGNLKAQAYFKNDSGTYKEFYPDKKLKAEGKNVNGESDSTWTFYHENGKIKAQGDYANGLKTGSWIFYFPNGNISAQGDYVEGKKDDKWIYYHENGNISSQGALREGKKEGYWRLFNELGNFKAEGVFEEGRGTYKEYYENGNLKISGEIENGKHNGQWYYYYEDQSLEGECLYDMGNGNYIGYYPDGSVKMKGQIEDGTNTGLWELYKPDGSVAGYYRPLYEDKQPLYKMLDDSDMDEMGGSFDYLKPDYRYRKKQQRYFEPVINEFRGNILAFNPAAVMLSSLPVSYEYYYGERLGYEVLTTIYRDPFFARGSSISHNSAYFRGFDVALRQKFYHKEVEWGIPYFGHEIRYTSLEHLANVPVNATPDSYRRISADENKIEYSLIGGIRWMKLYGERWRKDNKPWGLTFDLFAGFGAGFRNYEPNFPSTNNYEAIFKRVNKNQLSIVPRLGINAGIVF